VGVTILAGFPSARIFQSLNIFPFLPGSPTLPFSGGRFPYSRFSTISPFWRISHESIARREKKSSEFFKKFKKFPNIQTELA